MALGVYDELRVLWRHLGEAGTSTWFPSSWVRAVVISPVHSGGQGGLNICLLAPGSQAPLHRNLFHSWS